MMMGALKGGKKRGQAYLYSASGTDSVIGRHASVLVFGLGFQRTGSVLALCRSLSF